MRFCPHCGTSLQSASLKGQAVLLHPDEASKYDLSRGVAKGKLYRCLDHVRVGDTEPGTYARQVLPGEMGVLIAPGVMAMSLGFLGFAAFRVNMKEWEATGEDFHGTCKDLEELSKRSSAVSNLAARKDLIKLFQNAPQITYLDLSKDMSGRQCMEAVFVDPVFTEVETYKMPSRILVRPEAGGMFSVTTCMGSRAGTMKVSGDELISTVKAAIALVSKAKPSRRKPRGQKPITGNLLK